MEPPPPVDAVIQGGLPSLPLPLGLARPASSERCGVLSRIAQVLAGSLLLAGCGAPPLTEGVEASAARAVVACEALEGSARDWCAIQSMESAITIGDISGVGMSQICRRLSDPDAVDRCAEMSVRHDVDPASHETCELVDDELIRYSCILASADRQLTRPLQDVVTVCADTGPLLEHCATHVAYYRAEMWGEAGFEVMSAEVSQLLDGIAGLRENVDFGVTVGRIARYLGARHDQLTPCEPFRYGEPRLACELAIQDADFGR